MTDPGDGLAWEQRRLAESVVARARRVEQALEPGPVTATATTDDGLVSVTVELGGGLRSIRLAPRALRLGADQLARTILAVARQATARANQGAHAAAASALGRQAGRHLEVLGLSYDPTLAEDTDVADDPLGHRRHVVGP